MINNANIMKAIKTRLRADIPTIEVQSTDFKNPLPPCFMVENVAYTTTPVADNVDNIITTFNVVYFSAKTLY